VSSSDRPSDSDLFYVCPECNRWYREALEVCPEDGSKLRRAERPEGSLIGEELAGRFLIDGLIGEGGMATVYRALQQPIGRPVAIKVLHRNMVHDSTWASRFLNEAQAASALVNPNTVTIHDFGQTPDGSLFIAMEYPGGKTLAEKVARGPLPVATALEVAAQVCRALSEAHRKGIVHRDLKPENIILSVADDGSLLAKVVDFGIAKVLRPIGRSESEIPVTQEGVIIGTPRYMSPEQGRGQKPSPASDLYALGVILFEMISGRAPFDHERNAELVAMHIEATPPELSSPLEPVDHRLAELVAKLLAKSPEERPENAESVGTSLRELLSGEPVTASEVLDEASRVDTIRIPFVPPEADGSQTIDEPAPTEALPVEARRRMPRALTLAIVLGVVTVCGVVVGFLMSRSAAQRERETTTVFDRRLFGAEREGTNEDTAGQVARPSPSSNEPASNEQSEEDLVLMVLQSEPPAARVSVGDQILCSTPCRAELPRGKRLPVRFLLRGYRAKTVYVVPESGAVLNVGLEPSL